jgi:hypothetical protein
MLIRNRRQGPGPIAVSQFGSIAEARRHVVSSIPSGSGDGDLPLLNAFNGAILASKSFKSGVYQVKPCPTLT